MVHTGSSSTEASAVSSSSSSASPSSLASNNQRNNNDADPSPPPPPVLGAVTASSPLSMATMAGAVATVAASSTTTTPHPLPFSFIPSTLVPFTPQWFQQLNVIIAQLEENAANEEEATRTVQADADNMAKIIRTHREQMAAKSVCVICLDARPNIATLCCGQPVHQNCFATWLLKSPTCMYCRAAFPPSQEGERLPSRTDTATARTRANRNETTWLHTHTTMAVILEATADRFD